MQERVLSVLKADGSEQLTRARYEEIAGVSRSQAAYDLAELVEAGILVKLGGGRATRYRLTQPSHANGHARRRWTNDRIRSELERFCAERDAWPSAGEFKAAGHSDLYVAASRYGGVGFWARELGFSRPARNERPTPLRPRRRRRPTVRWLAAAAVLAAALVATGGASLRALRDAPARGTGLLHQASAPSFVPKRLLYSAAQPKQVTARAAPKKKHVNARRRVDHPRPAPAVQAPAARTELAAVRTSAPTYTAPTQSAPPARTSSPPSSGSGGGPAPLAPPPGGSGAPQPIPPPHR